MKPIRSSAGRRCLAPALVSCLAAGCGSEAAKISGIPGQANATDGWEGPPPKTERARKAAEFEKKLRSQSRHD